MPGARESLFQALADRLTSDGYETGTATYIAHATAARVTIDDLGIAVDLADVMAAVKAENADVVMMAQAATAQPGQFNPWAAATLNITKQAILSKSDPVLAAKLKAEAI